MMKHKQNRINGQKIILFLSTVLILLCIILFIGIRYPGEQSFDFHCEVPEAERQLRLHLVETAEQWLGYNEQSGSHKEIIDLYNAFEPLAQGYTVQYDDQWCATFVSAAAIESELTDIIPTRQIELFQQLDSWEEADDYMPLPGDIIYYCRSNTDMIKDCTGWSDHVGIVVGTNGNKIKVLEGNYGDAVAYRKINVDATIIRGYAVPDYSSLCN